MPDPRQDGVLDWSEYSVEWFQSFIVWPSRGSSVLFSFLFRMNEEAVRDWWRVRISNDDDLVYSVTAENGRALQWTGIGPSESLFIAAFLFFFKL
jgi:hypothetical protein